MRTGTPDELREVLGGPPPEQPGDAMAAMELLTESALLHMQHGDHPRYFARVPGPSSFAGVLGDWLGTGFNAIAASWKGGSGPATVELVVLDWLRSLLGMPEGTEGVLASGGSLANVTALATARAVDGPGVAYLSDQTHSSIGRGLVALGFAAWRRADGSHRRRDAHAGGRRRGGDRRGPGGRPAAGICRCQRGHHQHRFGRSAASRWPTCAPSRGCGSTSTAHTELPRRSVSRAVACSTASSARTRSCSTRTSGCSSRTTSAACWCAGQVRSTGRST